MRIMRKASRKEEKLKIKAMTKAQRERAKRNRDTEYKNQMIGREALGFNKMKIKGRKPGKFTPEEEYDHKIASLYTQTQLTSNPMINISQVKPIIIN